MNRINTLFQAKQNNILSVYFTAGHPKVDSAPVIIKALADAGVDMIEIGMPFSDPIADGPVIQNSSSIALKNGMSLKLLFEQLKEIRKSVEVPLLLMGYLNPVLQYGIEKFCQDCNNTGIDGVILPDLPLEVFESNALLNSAENSASIKDVFAKYKLHHIFLVSPQTPAERIVKIDENSEGFIYMVSSSSTTGIRNSFTNQQREYFKRVAEMKLKNPLLVGFGISSRESISTVSNYASGVIIGSAFVKMLNEAKDLEGGIKSFIREISIQV